MSVRFIAYLALISAVTLISATRFRYDGYHVVSAKIDNDRQRDFVEQLDAASEEIQLLGTVDGKATLVIPPYKLADIENMFSKEGLVYQVETTNLQE